MTIDCDRLLDILDKAHTGPVARENEWNIHVIPAAIAKYLNKYNLKDTCDASNPVNLNDDLADHFFQAGLDVAVETGLRCTDTHRVIKFTQDEIMTHIGLAPSEFTLGKGDQQVTYKHRELEDTFPVVWTVPLSIAVSEPLFVKIVEALARIPEVKTLQGPSLETLWGRPIRSGSPYELLAGKHQADLMAQGVRAAGREGMPLEAVGTSPTHYGTLGGFGVPGGYLPDRDIVLILSQADLVTSYESLFKLAHAFNCEAKHVSAGSWCMLGGYSGGPEGTAICSIAYTLLLFSVFQCSKGGAFPFSLHYSGNTGREAQWSFSILAQAISRNTHLIMNSVVNQVAGPCTKMLLYETLVGFANMAASGVSATTGTRSAGGAITNCLTPLEHQFGGEVLKASVGLSRAKANEIARQFIPKYENELRNPPKGKGIKESYDLTSMKPSDDWRRLYEEVKEEVIRAGIPLT